MLQEKALEYLFGSGLIKPHRVVFCIFIFIGAYTKPDLVWAVGDVFNGLMAVPNLIALLILSKVVLRETNRYYPRTENRRHTPTYIYFAGNP